MDYSKVINLKKDINLPPDVILTDKTIKLPVLKNFIAKKPLLDEDNILGYLNHCPLIDADFALIIHDESLIDMKIKEDDLVYINRKKDLCSGDVGAVLIDNKITVRRLYFNGDDIILGTCDNACTQIVLNKNKVEILGKLEGYMHVV